MDEASMLIRIASIVGPSKIVVSRVESEKPETQPFLDRIIIWPKDRGQL